MSGSDSQTPLLAMTLMDDNVIFSNIRDTTFIQF